MTQAASPPSGTQGSTESIVFTVDDNSSCRYHHTEVEYGHKSFHVVDPKVHDKHI
jgi:hypothetical protein